MCVAALRPKQANRKVRFVMHHFVLGHIEIVEGSKGWALVGDTLDV